MYGDKAAALARIKASFTELLPQNVKDRVVLENDEMCYNAEDLLPLCEELDVPLVFGSYSPLLYTLYPWPSPAHSRTRLIYRLSPRLDLSLVVPASGDHPPRGRDLEAARHPPEAASVRAASGRGDDHGKARARG